MISPIGQRNTGKANPVRNDGAFSPAFLLRIEIYSYFLPVINGGLSNGAKRRYKE
jgi:hypothetical protein